MKRFFSFTLFALLSIAGAFAQGNYSGFVGNGYYRINNFATNRYIYVTDNKDYYNKAKDEEDFQAIQLWKDINKAVSEPASVIFIKQVSSDAYDLQAQGTGVHALTGMYVNVKQNASDGTYQVYATRAGVTKYLSDDESSASDQGMMGTKQKQGYRKWYVDRITTNHTTNYFGIKPTISLNGKYYQPFYAAFPFKTASAGMHVYYVSKVVGNEAFIKEIVGEVPASTPVIIECASASPSDNRLELLNTSSAKVNGNKLGGVYFCNGKRPQGSTDAYKVFDPATMRILSVVNGKLVMTNDDQSRLNKIKITNWETLTKVQAYCLFANTSYLKADASTPAVLDITIDGSGIDEIIAEKTNKSVEGVYTLTGAQLRKTNDLKGLPAGLYIVGGVKVVVK